MKTDWNILLVGGSSGVGKSQLARQLSELYKTPVTEVDDIRIAMQQIADKAQYPELFTFINNPNFHDEYNEKIFTEKLLKVGEVVWKSLSVLISKHSILKEQVIFEGDGIIPELLTKINLDKIKTLFIYDEFESIKERKSLRDRLGIEKNQLDKDSLFSYAYGEAIKKQADTNGFLTIKASPLDTLFDRAVELLKSN